MAAAVHPVPPPAPLQPIAPQPGGAPAVQTALVPVEKRPESRSVIHPDSVIARLPVEVEVGVPVRDFRVRNLLALEPGAVVASQSSHGEDLPLFARDVRLAWTQFEVVDDTLAARITRIA